MRAPRLWRLTKWLPRSWRLALLEALAWPEFEVKRLWLDQGGVCRITMAEGEERSLIASIRLHGAPETMLSPTP